eukprot:gene3225-4013_t
MTALALKQISETDGDVFLAACRALFQQKASEEPALRHSASKSDLHGRGGSFSQHTDEAMLPPAARPPVPGAHRASRPRPPEGQLGELRNYSKANPPPVTVTGVAPWAMNSSSNGSSSSSSSSAKAAPVHSLEQRSHTAHPPDMPAPHGAIAHSVQEHKRM